MANKYKRKAEPLNRWVALIMALISIFMGTVFSSTMFLNQPIEREDATELNCVFLGFGGGHKKLKGGTTDITLHFKDNSFQFIDNYCVSDELIEKLKTIPSETEFKMLVNPKNDYIVELIANEEILLDFDYAQKQLERNGVRFFYLGIVMYVFAIIFIIQAILDFKKKIKRAKAKKSKK